MHHLAPFSSGSSTKLRFGLSCCVFVFACSSRTPSGATKPSSQATSPTIVGNKWRPDQLRTLAKPLAAAGLTIEAERLGDTGSAPLGAVVAIPGCSASFVSSRGLIITNHHCTQGILAYLSTPENDLVARGFVAKTPSEELWGGPTRRVLVPIDSRDVTSEMRSGLAAIEDPRERTKEIDRREKKLIAACEQQNPRHRCKVSSYYGGGELRLSRALELRDLRLVMAPPESIGAFGGDTDNWMWPRHAGDFAFLRAYVGPDGAPADFSKENIPFEPAHWLSPSSEAVANGDLIIVAGYPGRTMRTKPLEAVREAIEWSYPAKISAQAKLIKSLEELMQQGGKTAIIARNWLFAYQNAHKRDTAILNQLRATGVIGFRAELRQRAIDRAQQEGDEETLRAFEALKSLYRDRISWRDTERTIAVTGDIRLLSSALTLVTLAHERAKIDSDRKLAYQERNWATIRGRLESLDRTVDISVDAAMMSLVVDSGASWFRSEVLAVSKKPAPSDTRELCQQVLASSRLMDLKTRIDLFENATAASIVENRDPLIQLALALYREQEAVDNRSEVFEGELALQLPKTVEAIRRVAGPFAPDANRSLRVSFGHVRPPSGGQQALTGLPDLVAKHTGKPPFDAPQALLDAAGRPLPAKLVHPSLGTVPVDFLSDIDLTGGSSGSPTLDRHGRLLGVAFDTNIEAVSSDWQYRRQQRAMHVHIRYIFWLLDNVLGGAHIAEEIRRGE